MLSTLLLFYTFHSPVSHKPCRKQKNKTKNERTKNLQKRLSTRLESHFQISNFAYSQFNQNVFLISNFLHYAQEKLRLAINRSKLFQNRYCQFLQNETYKILDSELAPPQKSTIRLAPFLKKT